MKELEIATWIVNLDAMQNLALSRWKVAFMSQPQAKAGAHFPKESQNPWSRLNLSWVEWWGWEQRNLTHLGPQASLTT